MAIPTTSQTVKYARCLSSGGIIFACPFSEGAGLPNDLHGNKLSTAMTNASWVAGRDGWAAKFAGGNTNQKISWSDGNLYTPVAADAPFCFVYHVRFKSDTASNMGLISTLKHQVGGMHIGVTSNGALGVITGQSGANNAQYTANGLIADDRWYDVVWNCEIGASLVTRIYAMSKEGGRVIAQLTNTLPLVSPNDLVIGNHADGGTAWDGLYTVSEVRIYKTTHDIRETSAALMNGGFM